MPQQLLLGTALALISAWHNGWPVFTVTRQTGSDIGRAQRMATESAAIRRGGSESCMTHSVARYQNVHCYVTIVADNYMEQ